MLRVEKMKAAAVTLDATLLRNALRLVHCIQKERGASCAYYADHVKFEEQMISARSSSDAAARLMNGYGSLPVSSSLEKIRHLIQEHADESVDEIVFHRIFVCFNTLISCLVHEYILKHVEDKRRKISTVTFERKHERGLSQDLNDKLSAEWMLTPPSAAKRVLSSEINHKLSSEWLLTPPLASDHKTYPSIENIDENIETAAPVRRRADSDDDVENDADAPSPPDSKSLVTPLSPKKVMSSGDKHPEEGNEPLKAQRLLNLLNYFVQLKESTGVERAILSSVLAFGDRVDVSRFHNDLILEVENQRNLVAQLENLRESPLRNLILELAQLSPSLLEIQNKILNDFSSLNKSDYDSEKIWKLITLYIDKLHSLELLIIEELECELPSKEDSDDPNQALSVALQGLLSSSKGVDLVSKIESMEADELKKHILASLKATSPEESKVNILPQPPLDDTPQNQYTSETAVALSKVLKKQLGGEKKKAVATRRASSGASSEWEINIYEIKFQKRIGQGASATTYLGSWTGGQQVAIKVASITEFGLEGWRTEVAALQKLHHPNIIRLLGSIEHKSPLTYCLVLEYCNAGDLATALKYPTPRNFLFHVAISIANAMSYLHSRHVIHRDLKPANVLCDGNVASGNFVVKVTDFGVATEDGDWPETQQPIGGPAGAENAKNLTGETGKSKCMEYDMDEELRLFSSLNQHFLGTYRWMAPEVVRREPYSNMADVYSFAIMLWQFVTHEEPYYDLGAAEAACLVAGEMLRPPIPEKAPAGIRELIEANWSDDPNSRCKFERVAETLKTIQGSLLPQEKTWLESAHGHPVYHESRDEEEKEAPKPPKLGGKVGKGGQKKDPHRAGSLLGGFFGMKKK